MQRFGLIAIVIVATFGLIRGGTAPAEAGDGNAFEAIDTNNDTKIDLKEFLAAAGRTFDTLDTDKNGSLDENELKSLKTPIRDFLRDLDANGDGKLDRDEFLNGAETYFHELDANNDGQLEPKEFDQKRESSVNPFIILRF